MDNVEKAMSGAKAQGHHFGWYFAGRWAYLPDQDPEQRTKRGQAAAALLKQVIDTELQKSGRTCTYTRDTPILYAKPPFAAREAIEAGRNIQKAWEDLLKKPFAENVREYLDDFRSAR